ncbi:chryseobasin-related MNIO class RiPP peptide [Fibrella forsythiae]|uniref:Lipoprotein n=1 Tax=Fibrella forsythiae TaxID=2817061 RepID=A0ABS3JQ62_9BACT|nr:hypothetical protein [Fibrella forsythiae]MBO0951359.1 hypothetical protein [Fibrella forsythiae]
MKVSKMVLKAMALAVTVSTVTACINDKVIKPKSGEPEVKKVPYDCPGCGMG